LLQVLELIRSDLDNDGRVDVVVTVPGLFLFPEVLVVLSWKLRYPTTVSNQSPPPPAEVRPVLTKAEERFEHWRKTVGFFLGPLASVVVYLVPFGNLQSHRLAAVLIWVIVWWVTEPVPIPIAALLGVILCVITGVAPAVRAFAPLADPIIYLFLGSFLIARAMSAHGLDKRFAFRIMALDVIGGSNFRLMLAYGGVAALISMWISNTATTAMLAPIGIGIVGAMARAGSAGSDPRESRFATGFILVAAYASSTGGIGTPIGSPPNLIGIAMIEKQTGVRIPFFQWMALTVPCLVALFALVFLMLYFLHKPGADQRAGSQEYVKSELARLGPWSRGQKNTLAVFLITVTLWVIPGFLALIWGVDSSVMKGYSDRIPEAVAALVGGLLLFILPVDWSRRKFTLNWKQAAGIDWGTLILFGAGLSLGDLMFRTGLAESVGRGILDISGTTSLGGITLVAIIAAIVLSETTSNTAAANMIVPVMISVAMAAHLNPIPPALGATLGASWAFMLPVSTPPNAIVYGTGLVPITRMIRAGVILNAVGATVLWLGLLLLLPILGLW
jgi:sodium-dependent dicarboxylate transporter 2/3/5